MSSVTFLETPGMGKVVSDKDHFMFIDAGSGGTRIHLIHATIYGNNSFQLFEVDSYKSLALHDTVYMQADLIRGVNSLKLKHEISTVKGIWLRATAGLRLLPPKKRDQYISDIEYLLSSTFPNEFESAEIMSGEEEALFEWIQQNSKDGIFMHKNTKGAICVGGASVQVIFDMDPFPRPNIIAFKKTPILDGKMFYMYTHSWLGYGQNTIIGTFIHDQIKKERFECGCLSTNYNPKDNLQYHWPQMIGSSNFGECLYAIQDFVDILDSQCNPPTCYDPCVFGDYMQPHEGITFRATGKLGKYASLAKKTLNLDSIDVVRPAHFRQAARIVCDIETAKENHTPNCFSLIFYHMYLNRLGFGDWDDSIEFIDGDQGWVEGALRYQLSNYNIRRDF